MPNLVLVHNLRARAALLALLSGFLCNACSGPKVIEPLAKPHVESNWPNTADRADLSFLSALRASQDFLTMQAQDRLIGPAGNQFSIAEYQLFLAELGNFLESRQEQDLPLLPFLQSSCDLWRLSSGEASRWLLEEIPWPLAEASPRKTSPFVRPVLGRPRDLVEVRLDRYRERFPNLELGGLAKEGDLGALPQAVYGRRIGPAPGGEMSQIVPYFGRERILEHGGAFPAPVLAWVDEASEKDLQEMEGGTLRFASGEEWFLGFAADNGVGSDASEFNSPRLEERAGSSLGTLVNRHVFFRKTEMPESRWGTKLIPERTLDLVDVPLPLSSLVFWRDSNDEHAGRFLFALARRRNASERAFVRALVPAGVSRSLQEGELYWLVPNQTSLARVREKYKTFLGNRRVVE